MPLIDAQTCNAYYQENSVSSTEPVILEDMLCAGFVEGGKDACNVSDSYPDSGPSPVGRAFLSHHTENLPEGLGIS